MGADPLTIMAIASLVGAGGSLIQQRKADKRAEADAALQRATLAELQQEPPAVMPTVDDEATRRARRRSIASTMARRGRASTILTDSGTGDTLGSA